MVFIAPGQSTWQEWNDLNVIFAPFVFLPVRQHYEKQCLGGGNGKVCFEESVLIWELDLILIFTINNYKTEIFLFKLSMEFPS